MVLPLLFKQSLQLKKVMTMEVIEQQFYTNLKISNRVIHLDIVTGTGDVVTPQPIIYD